jgi:hypothetical protein
VLNTKRFIAQKTLLRRINQPVSMRRVLETKCRSYAAKLSSDDKVWHGDHMSDWDFLHEMHHDGYSPEQIADAAACGYNPWEWEPLHENELPASCPQDNPELVMIFESLVENAMSYHALTGRYLQIWGELGEFYAEIQYGIKRHKPHTRGSDGKLGNDYIEIKTISPEKDGGKVQVKRAGNFSKLLVIKISEKFEFEGQLIERKRLTKGEGKYASVSWSALATSKQVPQA